jgi:hypothetical protein
MNNKKIYGVPLSVARRINEGLADSNILVIETVLARFDIKLQRKEWRERYGVNEDWHKLHKIGNPVDKGCGCMYCQAVHRYVSAKVSHHRLRRRLDDWDYMYRPYETPESLRQLRLLENEWPELRKIKENMRMLAGL